MAAIISLMVVRSTVPFRWHYRKIQTMPACVFLNVNTAWTCLYARTAICSKSTRQHKKTRSQNKHIHMYHPYPRMIPVETTMSTSTNDFPTAVVEKVCTLPVVCLQTANFDLNVGDIIRDKNTIIGAKR